MADFKFVFYGSHETACAKLLAQKVTKRAIAGLTIERRYVLGDIDAVLYAKYKEEFEMDLVKIKDEISKCVFNLSNLENAIDNALECALQPPAMWENGDLIEKRRIQKMKEMNSKTDTR